MRIEGTCRIVDEVGFDAEHHYGEIVIGGDYFGASVKSIHVGERLANHLKSVGVKLVIASSFGRSFYRNCVNSGLPVLECIGIVAKVHDGDVLQVDLQAGTIRNASTGDEIRAIEVPKPILAILDLGGIVGYTRAKVRSGMEV